MNEALDIRTLTIRFLDGTTTLEEEQLLYGLYADEKLVPDDLKSLRQMFLDYAAVAQPAISEGIQTKAVTRHWPHRRLLAAAATLALLLLGGTTALLHHYRRANECVVYIYGQKVTDRQQVLAEMQQSLALFGSDETDGTDIADAQLRDLFSTEE